MDLRKHFFEYTCSECAFFKDKVKTDPKGSCTCEEFGIKPTDMACCCLELKTNKG